MCPSGRLHYRAAAALAGCLAALPGPVGAADLEGFHASLGASQVYAGDAVELTQAVAGSVYAAGDRVVVAAPVAGSARLAGGSVEVVGPVGGGVQAAGQRVVIGGRVGRGLRAAAETLEILPGARVEGDARLWAREVRLAGSVGGAVRIAARSVTVDGVVDGDADVDADDIDVGPAARIGGRLRYRGRHPPRLDPAAVVSGGVEARSAGLTGLRLGVGPTHPLAVGGGWLGGSVLLGLVLLLVAPALVGRLAARLRGDPPAAFGFGAAFLIGVPVMAVALCLTLVGIPLALAVLALYAASLVAGHLLGLVLCAQLALGQIAPARAGRTGWRALALLATAFVLALAAAVPLAGSLLRFAVLLAGLGTLVLAVTGRGATAR